MKQGKNYTRLPNMALFAPQNTIFDPKITPFFDIIPFDINYLVWPDHAS